MVSPTALTSAGSTYATVPGDGAISAWEVIGDATLPAATWKLSVLHPNGGGYVIVGENAFATTGAHTVSPPLPVQAGDHVAIVTRGQAGGPTGMISVATAPAPGASADRFEPSSGAIFLPDPNHVYTPDSVLANVELLFHATVDLIPPVATSIGPATGSTVGGESVTLTGDHLAGATGVKFGETPATSTLSNSNQQVTAVAPAGSAGAVDVTVVTAGGTATLPGAYTYVAPPPGDPPAATPDVVAPDVSILSGPKGKTTKRKPVFAFESGDPQAHFECSVDDADPETCTSPTKVKKLKVGKHTFSVVAIDPAANRGAADERKFKVARKHHE
jgi:IPT/TIG domain